MSVSGWTKADDGRNNVTNRAEIVLRGVRSALRRTPMELKKRNRGEQTAANYHVTIVMI